MAELQSRPLSNETQDSAVKTLEHRQPTDWRTRLVRHLNADIACTRLAVSELLLLTWSTDHCFASNQTGNTVLLAVSITGVGAYDSYVPENCGIALGLFAAGGFIIGQAGHYIGPRRRLWILFSNIMQTILVYIAAAIQHFYGVHTYSLAVIGLLAFASGSQVVLSRAWACPEISTAMATAAWVDLLVDPKLLLRNNGKRNRRLAFLAALFLGALAGAYIHVKVGSAFVLLVSAIGKTIVCIMLFFNSADHGSREETKEKGDVEMAATQTGV